VIEPCMRFEHLVCLQSNIAKKTSQVFSVTWNSALKPRHSPKWILAVVLFMCACKIIQKCGPEDRNSVAKEVKNYQEQKREKYLLQISSESWRAEFLLYAAFVAINWSIIVNGTRRRPVSVHRGGHRRLIWPKTTLQRRTLQCLLLSDARSAAMT